jgi:hypothetical protein
MAEMGRPIKISTISPTIAAMIPSFWIYSLKAKTVDIMICGIR